MDKLKMCVRLYCICLKRDIETPTFLFTEWNVSEEKGKGKMDDNIIYGTREKILGLSSGSISPDDGGDEFRRNIVS